MVEQKILKNQVVKVREGQYQLIDEELKQELSPSQVIIQVAFTTVNPVDRHTYNLNKTEGTTLGSDGSGIIIKVGSNLDSSLIGTKASFIGSAFSRYKIEEFSNLLLLDESQDLEKAANAWINPYTAMGQLHLAKKYKATAAFVTAGASQLAQQWIKLGAANGILLIPIVRKDEHVKMLMEELGVKYAINQESESFKDQLKQAIQDLNPTLLFDYIGGEVPSVIFDMMPNQSKLVIVGALTLQPIPLNSRAMMYTDKEVKTFLLPRWLKSITFEERQSYDELVRNDLKEGGRIFGTHTVKKAQLIDWENAIKESGSVASEQGGKFIIDCRSE